MYVRTKLRNENFGVKRKAPVDQRKNTIAKRKRTGNEDEQMPKFRNGEEEQPPQKDKVDLSAIKLAFNTIVRPEFSELITDKFHWYSTNATMIKILGSLVMLYRVNDAVDTDDLDFFVRGNGTHVIRDCFNCVCQVNIANRENYPQMPEEFEDMAMRHAGLQSIDQWPTRFQMSGITNALIDQYKSNVTTNLTTHWWPRLQSFLRVKCFDFNTFDGDDFDEIDVRNAMKNLMLNEDWTKGEPDEENRAKKMAKLFQAVAELCPSFGNYLTIKEYVQKQWFESLWMWIKMQRSVDVFLCYKKENSNQLKAHEQDPEKNPKPYEPREWPKKVKNFTVIPLSDAKLKHVQMNHYQLIDLLGQLRKDNQIELPDGYREFYKRENNKDAAWNILFDIEKINALGTRDKKFWHLIQTNSVSASVTFGRPKVKGLGTNVAKMKNRYETGWYEVEGANDPGVRTKHAFVRRDLKTHVEVSEKHESKCSKSILIVTNFTDEHQNIGH